ncbi:Oidioi.mRNA.OKI2018_I69.chr1.g289.t1.cds [Oikopleura dioica]|uniref:Zinc finger CCHC domain-containing protein 7 n=1 Tax=Oikopleura dioica TaxID=34765 RepID=A0ABN7SNU7_OIKDI|nr:Oidioi.mRNA.OKI2018_I69.chr1.g289.t1.cds [Oikopleura dioica]
MNQRYAKEAKGNLNRKRFPKSVVIAHARTNSASSTPRSSPNNSPMLIDGRSRDGSPCNSPRHNPSIRSVISVTNKDSSSGRGVKRKSTDLDQPRKREKSSKSSKKKSKEKSSKKSSSFHNSNSSKSESRNGRSGGSDSKSHKMLKEIKREINMDSPSSSRSPLSNISQLAEPEHYTDNESEPDQLPSPPGKPAKAAAPSRPVHQKPIPEALQKLIPLSSLTTLTPFQMANPDQSKIFGKPVDSNADSNTRQKIDFHTLATGKSGLLTNEFESNGHAGENGMDGNYTSDSLDSLSDLEHIPEDDLQRLSLTFLNRYAAGDQQWCEDYPEHGMPCRKCGQKGHTVINCTSPPSEKCVLCGAYDHHHNYCPDTCELEYKNFVIPCFHCRQAGHLGRNCPDHWRQFHRTTSSKFTPFDNSANAKVPSCYNCAGQHYGHECTRERISTHGPVLKPTVTKRLTEHQSQIFDESGKIKRETRRRSNNKRKNI